MEVWGVAAFEMLKAVVTIGLSGLEAPLTTEVPVQPVVPLAPEEFKTAFISPAPPVTDDQLALAPSVTSALPELPVCAGRSAFNAVTAVFCPVPPFPIGSAPVTPVVSGKPVKFVATPLAGVPRFGVINVGDVAKTRLPVPVSSVTALARFALLGVPNHVATPAPKEVIPVPPFASGRIPVTPVVSGKPVTLVMTPLAGVPNAGVTNEAELIVGEVPKTKAPVPVSSVTAEARFALEGVPKKVAMPAPKEVIPVPPLATGRVPVTSAVREIG